MAFTATDYVYAYALTILTGQMIQGMWSKRESRWHASKYTWLLVNGKWTAPLTWHKRKEHCSTLQGHSGSEYIQLIL